MEWSLVFHDEDKKYSVGKNVFKYLARAIELAYLTSGKFDHMFLIMQGEYDLPRVITETLVESGIAVYEEKAYMTQL